MPEGQTVSSPVLGVISCEYADEPYIMKFSWTYRSANIRLDHECRPNNRCSFVNDENDDENDENIFNYRRRDKN